MLKKVRAYIFKSWIRRTGYAIIECNNVYTDRGGQIV